jgi:hypothetical protein
MTITRRVLVAFVAFFLVVVSGCFRMNPASQSATLFVPAELVKGLDLSVVDTNDFRINVLGKTDFIYYLSEKNGSPAIHYRFPHDGGGPVVYPGISKGAPIGMSNWAFIHGDVYTLNWKREGEDVWRSIRVDSLWVVEMRDGRSIRIVE